VTQATTQDDKVGATGNTKKDTSYGGKTSRQAEITEPHVRWEIGHKRTQTGIAHTMAAKARATRCTLPLVGTRGGHREPPEGQAGATQLQSRQLKAPWSKVQNLTRRQITSKSSSSDRSDNEKSDGKKRKKKERQKGNWPSTSRQSLSSATRANGQLEDRSTPKLSSGEEKLGGRCWGGNEEWA